jgi:hypothetical protein
MKNRFLYLLTRNKTRKTRQKNATAQMEALSSSEPFAERTPHQLFNIRALPPETSLESLK